ncbi:LuxR C-terminal-related transcriptional regulator [Mesorhizobium sp. BE184]|uniref:helix-turn-helix transcriptional regulator n=1 Tax=Mesorhizobium sp. BE184 TaxID=2817714 RepID=UPI0028566271|nr:LuxR C-terminal-related transcriptional regulator [Mesorhizobium sp. BE184]MDR7034718.1 DNA-binding CsgD family transcriptional regulator [Mesorhizobium sp. BE184]
MIDSAPLPSPNIPSPGPSETVASRLASRGDLTTFLMQLAAEIGADNYMLLATVHDGVRSEARILASNWIFDAVELAGKKLIAAFAQGPLATPPGVRPRPFVASQSPDAGTLINREEAKLLEVLGHAEIYSLRLDIGRQRLFGLFSSAETGSIDQPGLMKAQMKCCYALSQIPQLLAAATMQDPLSDRERECLFWVSEGKTTDEVAVILGVSSNTVNSYITHAIQKFSASNRAMAIATAIRSGII